ncbi:PLP-dependent aminotransferase family protein [Arsenicitalea aurantiaca]|uniref:PLP-dependent aminotransferase family protein n=1 Tax=Arsenicitalea aurantiaca TaxID=1783274 RepID=A0A433XKG4_9HYPH|nr:PLP-dependent aminotransferase family protein [Arsenicitalea aurantiaca]RUT34571.1 PLP-dependent aminotransferase family protein [Arsenicitalea aurantiaca]
MSLEKLPRAIAEGEMPLHERLADAIAAAIGAGALGPGERLPTHREISAHFGVAIGTVTKAIDSLSRRGIVRGEVGRGTFVQAAEAPAPETVNLTINCPLPVIRTELMQAAVERATRASLEMPFGGYVDLTGTEQQRGIVADWLSATRVPAGAEALVLCAGGQQAIHLAFGALKPITGTIVTESHTFPGAIAAAGNLGLEMAGVRVDREGMLPDALEAALKRTGARAVYTTPVCHNPLGFETGAARRQAILEICAANDAYIVEDDLYGFYGRSGAPTYKAMDGERVFYLSSLSKCLTPLIRLGVLFPPQAFRAGIARQMRAEIWGASPMAVNIGCALLELGAHAQATERLMREARLRVAMARDILGDVFAPTPPAAPHLWMALPMMEAERLARRAAERGVLLTPPGASAVGPESGGGVRLCLLAPKREADLERGLRIVGALLAHPDEAVV